ncbi:unnamed protein product [Penicillium glandicola]
MSSIKAPKRSFDEMFDTDATVDFTENLSDSFVMSTPQPNDKLVKTYKKVAKLAALVQKGKSLAIHTGYINATQNECDAITEAKKEMFPAEIEQFNAWVDGAAMPTVDWKNCREPVRLSEDEEAHFNQQFRAIQQIYHSRKITRENAYDKVSEACKVIQVRADEIHGKAVQYKEGIRGMGFPRAKE